MRFALTVIIIFLLTSCTRRERIIVENVSIVEIDSSDNEASPDPPTPDASVLQGAWTDGTTNNATFSFNKNRIYYVENLRSYPFVLQSDSITIKYGDHNNKGQLGLLNDTLLLRDEHGETKFWKFKK